MSKNGTRHKENQQAHRQRLKAAGKRQLMLWIDDDTHRAIRQIGQAKGLTNSQVIEKLVREVN